VISQEAADITTTRDGRQIINGLEQPGSLERLKHAQPQKSGTNASAREGETHQVFWVLEGTRLTL
jgi:hypothetical protein